MKSLLAGIVALVAALLALSAPPAIGTAPTNVVFVAGATAPQNLIQARIQPNANPGDCLTLVEDTTPPPAAKPTPASNNYIAYLCTANLASGVTAGNPILYYYTKKTGSYNGRVPVGQQTPVAHLNVTSPNTTCRQVGATTTYACTVQTAAAAADAPCIGSADQEPAA